MPYDIDESLFIDWHTLDPREVIFTWVDPDDDTYQLNFLVNRIIEASKDLEILLTPVNDEGAEMIRTHRGLEPHRLARITGIPPSWPPVIYLLMPDDTHLLIDGNHRYFRAWQMRSEWILTKVVPESIWKYYLVNLPVDPDIDDLLNGWSGIR